MLTDALHSQEQKALEKKTQSRLPQLDELDEFHAKQFAWSIPLIRAAVDLKAELKGYNNFKIETTEVSISMTIRPETTSGAYIDDLEFSVRTQLPSDRSPEKLFLCETVVPHDLESDIKVEKMVTVEEAISWLVEKAAMGIKGNF